MTCNLYLFPVVVVWLCIIRPILQAPPGRVFDTSIWCIAHCLRQLDS